MRQPHRRQPHKRREKFLVSLVSQEDSLVTLTCRRVARLETLVTCRWEVCLLRNSNSRVNHNSSRVSLDNRLLYLIPTTKACRGSRSLVLLPRSMPPKMRLRRR